MKILFSYAQFVIDILSVPSHPGLRYASDTLDGLFFLEMFRRVLNKLLFCISLYKRFNESWIYFLSKANSFAGFASRHVLVLFFMAEIENQCSNFISERSSELIEKYFKVFERMLQIHFYIIFSTVVHLYNVCKNYFSNIINTHLVISIKKVDYITYDDVFFDFASISPSNICFLAFQ